MKNTTKKILTLVFLLASCATSFAQIAITTVGTTQSCYGSGGSMTMSLSQIPNEAWLMETATGQQTSLHITSRKVTITGLGSGHYKLLMTDGLVITSTQFMINDCAGSTTPQVITLPTPGATTPLRVSIQKYAHQLRAVVSGGTPNYRYRWTRDGYHVGNGTIINNPSPGKYSLTVVDAHGNHTTAQCTISAPIAPPLATYTGCPEVKAVFVRGEQRIIPINAGSGYVSLSSYPNKGSATIINGVITYKAPTSYSSQPRETVFQYRIMNGTGSCEGLIRVNISPDVGGYRPR